MSVRCRWIKVFIVGLVQPHRANDIAGLEADPGINDFVPKHLLCDQDLASASCPSAVAAVAYKEKGRMSARISGEGRAPLLWSHTGVLAEADV